MGTIDVDILTHSFTNMNIHKKDAAITWLNENFSSNELIKSITIKLSRKNIILSRTGIKYDKESVVFIFYMYNTTFHTAHLHELCVPLVGCASSE
jgi:hypothetical protein